jgi:hypothetical protein
MSAPDVSDAASPGRPAVDVTRPGGYNGHMEVIHGDGRRS